MRRIVDHGVFQDVFGKDLDPIQETLEDDENTMPYYSVMAFKRVNGCIVFVGDMKSYEEPTRDAIMLTIKNFKADYAEVHVIYEALR